MKRLLLLLLLASACLAGLALWSYYHPAPTADGLAAYVATHRLDPLFAIEGTDPDALRHAVGEFFALYEQVLAQYPREERAQLERLYPAAFLALLPELEAARQDLLSAPTAASARRYHGLLVRTIGAYAADARAASALMRATAGAYPRTGYMTGTVELADLADKLDAAGESALSVQLGKEEARFACLHQAQLCPPPQTLLAQRADAIAPAATTAAPNAGVIQAAALTKRLNSLHQSYAGTEPALFAIESSCVAPGTTAYVQAQRLFNHHGAGRKLSYVNDVYFYDIAALHAALPDRLMWEVLANAGVAWQYQNIGNAYECPDAGYDQAAVSRLLGALEWLRAHAASEQEAGRILSLGTVSAADVAPYIRRQALVDSPASDALVARYIQGSSGFDQALLGALNDNGFLLASTTGPGLMPQYAFVIATRNYSSTLFLMGNPTFVPHPQSLFSTRTPQDLKSFFLRSYLKDLSRAVSDSALVAQYAASLRIVFPNTP